MTSATDNRTTELRELLDERGVEYEKVDGWWTSWETDGATSLPGVVYCEDLGDGLEIRWHTITPEQAIAATLGSEVNGNTSDGYHTFDELYYHRTALFACLVALQPRQMAFKSWKHSDGTMYEGFFIAGIYTSGGWCTYHCEARWWPLFDCHEQEFAPKWDGHTPSDAIHRLMSDFLPSQEVCGEVSE